MLFIHNKGYKRAENALFLSNSEGVNYDSLFRYPSRFIFNIDKTLLHYTKELEGQLIDDTKLFIEGNEKQLDNNNLKFKIDDIVEHKIFGRGKTIEIKEETLSYVIKFDKIETTRDINFNQKLKL